MNLFKKKKITEQLNYNAEASEKIYELDNEILKELERCEKISKNEKTLELFRNWQEEYKSLNENLLQIREKEENLKEFAQEGDTKTFYRETEDFLEHILYIEPFVIKFYEKLKNYTNYEIDNTQMALNLKERLKELTNLFDQKLKMIDVYNAVFIEETAKVKLLIVKFEDEQKKGNYPRARKILKDCNDSLVQLEGNIHILITYYEIMYNIEEKINSIKKMKNTLHDIELIELESVVEQQYLVKQQKREDLLANIRKIEFVDRDSLEISLNEVRYFDEQVSIYIEDIEESYVLIEEIFRIQKDNENQLKLLDELIAGAIEEKKTIEKLYSLENIEQFDKIIEEEKKYERFKADYMELNNIFKSEVRNFSIHKEKFMQSNDYLKRVLLNVKYIVEGLRAIRSDEIEIIRKLGIYKKELIDINLYLRKNDHLDALNSSLEIMYSEIIQKIRVLDEELQQEPLDISNVRINNDVIEKLIRKLIFDIETDIKQKKGVEKLILYYNMSVANHEHLEYYKHFLSLYNSKEYKQILKEIHRLFVQMNPRGGEFYKSIVSTVRIEEYKSII